MATIDVTLPKLDPIKGQKSIPLEEFFTSGHRTCQGCESALVMKMMAKAAGPRTIVLGSTGCMYVANTTYYSTSWVIPWMHTQLGSSGSAALGTAAALKSLMRKGKMKKEPINVIAFCGDGGGADMGLSAISATLTHPDYNCLILMYDNESYANTDIQLSGSTPYGANTTFSPPGKLKRIMHHRWKKNMAGMIAAGHPECKYVVNGVHVVRLAGHEQRPQSSLDRRPNIYPFPRSLPQGMGLRSDPIARVRRTRGHHGDLATVRSREWSAPAHRQDERDCFRAIQKRPGKRLFAKARPLRPLHGRGFRLFPKENRRHVGEVADSGSDSLP